MSAFQIGLCVAAVVVLLFLWPGPDLLTWAKSKWSARTVVTPPSPVSDDPDVLDMLALKRLTARYTNMKCPEGTAAMQTAAAHFFHETTGV